MVHKDHVWLIEKAVIEGQGVWADFGSGDGAFTLALRDVAGKDVEIYSIDQNAHRLQTQREHFKAMFPDTTISFLHAEFTKPLDLPLLDGILMANSLHYVQDKVNFLQQIQQYLKPRGKFVLVEYNVDKGNIWVPYPLSFDTFVSLAEDVGFSQPELLHTIPSGFLHEIYSAITS